MQRKKKTFGLLLLALPAFAFLCLAQEGRGKGRLTGSVVDEEQNPIAGVTLNLVYEKYDFSQSTVTNEKGQWFFGGLGMGQVSITAEMEGYIKSGLALQVFGAKKNPIQKIVMKKPNLENAQAETGVSDDAKSKFNQGNTFYNNRQFPEALEMYREFYKENPTYSKVALNIANCLLETGEYDSAISEYTKVIEGLNQEAEMDIKLLAQMNASIGDAYLRQKKYEQATEYFIKSMKINPTDHILAYNVAEIMMSNNNVEDAIKYYEQAIVINPQWAKSYLKLGYARLNKGEIKQAKEAFKLFLEKSPADDPEVEIVKEVISSL